jgi:hypothetical protein
MLPREARVKSWRRAVGERRDMFLVVFWGNGVGGDGNVFVVSSVVSGWV